MIGKRRSRELFELLGDKKKEPKRPVSLPKYSSAEQASDKQSSGTSPMIILKQETCIFGAIILILLVIFAFISGYYRGRNDAGAHNYNALRTGSKYAEQQVASAVRPRPATVSSSVSVPVPPLKETVPIVVSGTQPAPSPKRKYVLRVWTGGRSAVGKAREVVEFFKSKGFSSWSKKDSEGIKVFVGRFASKSDADASRTMNQVRELVYRGSKPFQDCYFVRLEK